MRRIDVLPLPLQHLTAGVPADPGDSVAMLPVKACKAAADAVLTRQVRRGVAHCEGPYNTQRAELQRKSIPSTCQNVETGSTLSPMEATSRP